MFWSGYKFVYVNKWTLYCWDFTRKGMNFDSIEHCVIFESNDDKYKKRSKLVELHKQFCHASPNYLKKLLKNTGFFSTEISKLIGEVCDNCVVCKTH